MNDASRLVGTTPNRLPFGNTCCSTSRKNSTPLTLQLSCLSCFAVTPAVGDLAVLAPQNVFLLNHTPVQVTLQIDKRWSTVAHTLAVNHSRRRQVGVADAGSESTGAGVGSSLYGAGDQDGSGNVPGLQDWALANG